MKLKVFLTFLTKVLKWVFSVLAVIILGFVTLFTICFVLYKIGLIEYDARESCIDDGKVWDGNLQKCRDELPNLESKRRLRSVVNKSSFSIATKENNT